MKSYACYPGTRYRPAFTRSANPYFTPYYTTNQNDTGAARPAANILRKEAAYVIELAVPGLQKDQIKIEAEQDQLIVSALNPETESKGNVVRREFDYANFKRIFRLHKNANIAMMSASFNQGILTIVIPDKEPETIKISIQ